MVPARAIVIAIAAWYAAPAIAARESIEFVQEHLAEIVMDNRYASLPVWSATSTGTQPHLQFTTQAAYANTHTGELTVDGGMFSLGRLEPSTKTGG